MSETERGRIPWRHVCWLGGSTFLRNMKLKIRFISLGLTLLFSVVLILHMLLDAGFGQPHFHDHNARDADVRNFDIGGDNHMSIGRKRLNKSNYTSGDNADGIEKPPQNVQHLPGGQWVTQSPMATNFTDVDVDAMIQKLQQLDTVKYNKFVLSGLKNHRKLKKKRLIRKGSGLPVYKNYKGTDLTNWEKYHMGIHQYGLYSEDDPSITGLLLDMATQPIVDVEMKDGGTQLKLIITFTDEGQSLFKPMRFSREVETLPNHFYFSDYERHNAEIAAFHLDRTLGFYRVPPHAGRLVNMTYDLKRLAESKLARTFFVSPAGNMCFHGDCSYYCDTGHAFCGNPDMLEGSFAAFLPPEKIAPRKTWRNPWKRSYSKRKKAYWEVYDDLCEKVRMKAPYNTGRRLLDLMDLHVFDFLTGNMDRHHYETFLDFGNETFLLHLDNGRSFGKTKHDEMSILAPLHQCCLIRYSTFLKLVGFYQGPRRLGDFMRDSLSKDKISPILVEGYYSALDRRVMKILKVIADCLKDGKDHTNVIIDDFY